VKALLQFHLRVGARVAIRSFIPLFTAVLVAIMIQMYPVAAVISIALRAYAARPTMEETMLMVAAALVLPVWAVSRLALGMNGWMKHLPISRVGNRRGLTLALLIVQMPFAVGLLLLAVVAHAHGLSVTVPMIRWGLILAAGACAAAPVHRQWLTAPVSLAAAFLSVQAADGLIISAAGLLVVADLFAGPVRRLRRRPPKSSAGPLLDFRISWRALGWRALGCYALGVVPVAAMALFISNNELTGTVADGAGRFGTAIALLVVISGMARRLAVRRPPWPLARSFPWSAGQRVAGDALFLGLHALPLLILGALVNPTATVEACALVPLLSIRAAGCMRQMPARRTGEGRFVAEGIFFAGSSALSAWALLFWLAAAFPAFRAAREAEARQKVTRWLELHYATAGDSQSWSD